jgi:predicted PurR-regulated permease PerM
MSNAPQERDITRTTLVVLGLGVLITLTYWIVRPLLPSFIWAGMIVIATWPVMLRVQAWLWGKRGLAVAVMTAAFVLVLMLPIAVAVGAIVANADGIVNLAKSLETRSLGPPPEWVASLPLAGRDLARAWQEFASSGSQGILKRVEPYIGNAAGWLLSHAGSMGRTLVQFLLTVIIAAILFARGETAALHIRRFARRLAGGRGEDAAILAAKAVRGVALGVIVTALIQAVVGGIGLAVTGVPGAGVLTAIMFVCCIAQLGAPPVLVPSVIWLYWGGHNFSGTVLLVWTLVVTTMDNFLRPMLIKKGADLPLLLVFTGVIGGVVSLGIIGIFVGPAVLAVVFALIEAWIDMGEGEGAKEPAADAR